MRLVSEWKVGDAGKKITLVEGDLSAPSKDVDVLVVSAFPNDYLPTPGSLIGALARAGISVTRLAETKEIDLREDFSCWLSTPVVAGGLRLRVLCVESGWRGKPPEIADDVFRALATAMLGQVQKQVVAMPIIGAGDQGYPVEQMLPAILRPAAGWLTRGLMISELRIVVRPDVVELAQRLFERARGPIARTASDRSAAEPPDAEATTLQGCDVFISYSHKDLVLAQAANDAIKSVKPDARIFFDRTTLPPGDSWLMRIAESLDAAQHVLALYTPDYWSSRPCKDEFVAAFTRQQDTGAMLLYPVYLRNANVPYLFRSLQFADCREGDEMKMTEACKVLALQLPRES